MDNEMIVWIVVSIISAVETGSWVGIAIFLIKSISKKVEDSTGLKGDLAKLNKKLSEVLEENQELKCRYDAFMLEMKGFRTNACESIRKNREAKK